MPADKSDLKRKHDDSEDPSSDSDELYYHPFVVVDKLRISFGCPASFVSGKLVWDERMKSGRSDEHIRSLLAAFIRSHQDGDSLLIRQEQLRAMWMAQYNAPACVFLAFFTCEDAVEGINMKSMTKNEAVDVLIAANVPFVPWGIFQDFLQSALNYYNDMDEAELPAIDWEEDYVTFLKHFKFNANNLPGSSRGKSVRSERSESETKIAIDGWQLALAEAKTPGLSQQQRDMLLTDGTVADDGVFRFRAPPRSSAEGLLRAELLAKHKAALEKVAAHDKQVKDQLRRHAHDEGVGDHLKRPMLDAVDDYDPDTAPPSGLLAHEKFMKTMRLSIERSDYINFASMSKDRLDQLHVLGVGSASTKRLSSSTVLLTSASESDVKIATFDFDAITSGFLYTYITLLSESKFENAMARVKDRLAWWQWLTNFFADNKPAAVKFIHWFMLAHHSEEFWLPVSKTQCVLLAIKAKEDCQPHLQLPSGNSRAGTSAQSKTPSKGAARVRTGPGTLTVPGGLTFSASQTAKLVQWRSRFPGSCASRMTKEYTCSKEKRGLPC